MTGLRTILLTVLAWCSLTLSAQDSGFQLDFHAGLSGCQVQGDGLSGFDKLGILVGLGVRKPLSDKWSLGFDINYAQKGSRLPGDPEPTAPISYRMHLDYIQVPLWLRYSYNERIGFGAGPSISVLLASYEEDFVGEITSAPAFNPLDVAFILGASYGLSEAWLVEVRFEQSVLPIREKEEGAVYLVGKQFNTVLGVNLVYLLK